MKQIEKVKKLYKPKFEIVRAEKVKDNYILFLDDKNIILEEDAFKSLFELYSALVSYYDVRKDETND
jgi:hypothetical protein|nr:MAG TPA: hypothetical protein [Caudoviricetes sp.]